MNIFFEFSVKNENEQKPSTRISSELRMRSYSDRMLTPIPQIYLYFINFKYDSFFLKKSIEIYDDKQKNILNRSIQT